MATNDCPIFILMKNFHEVAFEKDSKPIHHAIYFHALNLNNSLGWKKVFGLPTTMAMESLGIGSYKTYIKALDELIDWGVIEMVKKSYNHHNSNQVTLVLNTEVNTKVKDKALTKAILNNQPKQVQSNDHLGSSIDILNTTKQIIPNTDKNLKKVKSSRFVAPSLVEVLDFMIEKKVNYQEAEKEANKFWNFYDSKDWMIGKNKMKKWSSAASGWILKMEDFKSSSNKNQKTKDPTVNRQTKSTIESNSTGWDAP